MILFQFRSGVMHYFKNKYIILGQRVMSSKTERVTGPAVVLNAVGPGGPSQYIDTVNPVLIFNRVTGKPRKCQSEKQHRRSLRNVYCTT